MSSSQGRRLRPGASGSELGLFAHCFSSFLVLLDFDGTSSDFLKVL